MTQNRPPRLTKIPTNRGGRALLAHIRSTKLSIPVWCQQHGFDRIKIQNAINKGTPKHSVPFALEIKTATKGKVKVEWWAEELPEASAAAGSG